VVSNIKQQDNHLLVHYLIYKPERPAKLIIVGGVFLATFESAKLSRIIGTGQSLDSFAVLLLLLVSKLFELSQNLIRFSDLPFG
jgi:hypothetical protein